MLRAARPLARRLTHSTAATALRSARTVDVADKEEGDEVHLAGWLAGGRVLGGLLFLPLRDASGVVQLVCNKEDSPELFDAAQALPAESVVAVSGTVSKRPEEQVKATSKTGAVEVNLTQLRLLNAASSRMPLTYVDEKSLPGEEARLRHRALDLRSGFMARNMKMRAASVRAGRAALHDHGFMEVETPTLFRSTPEGAREFIVPTRRAGLAYALPQSPQQYKQLLMVGGVERYFQFARCYRDEDSRADRQPEFTQLDVEMAFVGASDVQSAVEAIVAAMWNAGTGDALARQCVGELDWPPFTDAKAEPPFRHMSYRQAMDDYGSDKPDTRFGMLISDVSHLFESSHDSPLLAPAASDRGSVRALHVPKLGGISRKRLKALVEGCGSGGARVMPVQRKAKEGGGLRWVSPLTKHVTEAQLQQLWASCGAQDDSLLLASVGEGDAPCEALGGLRLQTMRLLEEAQLASVDAQRFDWLWVTDFPLFTEDDDGRLSSSHHPFTAVVDEQAHLLATDEPLTREAALSLRGQHYDLVVNGVELGGGSIRMHDADMQLRVLRDVLCLSQAHVDSFSHLTSSLRLGAPPHGGFALGVDRMMAIMAGADSIRDVIAFPKSKSGSELLTGAPAPMREEELVDRSLQMRS
eukprot:PLAT5528.1.p1 GENE.PLAT5528.1~~PLAT5528.1.p1  ORF type:complete len:640 (-),score=215.17 PLAT5528.1:12-1931(-)